CILFLVVFFFFFSSRRRHTRFSRDWSSDVCSSDLFEGTVLSEGRGTSKPFQVFGHPSLPRNLYSFTPNPNEGAKSSKHYGKKCRSEERRVGKECRSRGSPYQ